LFHRLYLGSLQPVPFSLQLADGSEMQPLGKLEDVPVKIGDIWVLKDFIIADITETNDTLIILGRPFMAIVGCHIDVKRGWITFEVERCYAMFFHMEKKVVSLNSSLVDAFLLSYEIDMEDVLNCQDPPDFDWISIKDPDQGYAKVEFAAPMPPSILEVEAHASNESTMSDYCRFAQVVLLAPI